jgi:predicted acylesterase/phospholipase RssA
VIKTLHECNLLPRIISGASVGSIIAAIVATKKDTELTDMMDPKKVNLVYPC